MAATPGAVQVKTPYQAEVAYRRAFCRLCGNLVGQDSGKAAALFANSVDRLERWNLPDDVAADSNDFASRDVASRADSRSHTLQPAYHR